MNAFDLLSSTLLVLLPETALAMLAALMLTSGAFVRAPRGAWALLSAGLHGLAFLGVVVTGSFEVDPYAAPIVVDELAHFARLALPLTGILLIALLHDQVDDERGAEFFGCLALITAGAMLVSAANELTLLFLGLELVSIPTYVMMYLSRRDDAGREAATKYFLLSLFASGLLLFGFAYVYGIAGTAQLKSLAWLLGGGVPEALPEAAAGFGKIAVVFVLAGLSFRLAAAPLHFYAPDVYQGTSAGLAAMLAWVPKAVGVLAIVRVLTAVLVDTKLAGTGLALAWVLAAASLIVGNAMALLQDDLKRLLAWSSVSHGGYLLIGIAAAFGGDRAASVGEVLGTEAVALSLGAYALMTLGAFAAVLLLERAKGAPATINDLAGLAGTRPAVAAGLALCLLSLAGLPPTFGFWGKFELFAAALAAGQKPGQGALWGLAALGALASAVGAYYYLRPIVLMYLRAPAAEAVVPRQAGVAWPTALVLGLGAGGSLALGIFPGPAASTARAVAVSATSLPTVAQPEPTPQVADASP